MKENNNKGFTLIEILVAVIALALVVMPLLQGFVTTANLNKKSRERMMATNVAQSVMERFSTSTIEEISQDSILDAPDPYAENDEHKYTYSIVDYEHNNQKYDVKISIDASGYYGTGTRAFNEKGYPTITSVDTAQDAIYGENDRVLTDALNEFVNRTGGAYTTEQLESKLERTIRILVEDKLDGEGNTYTEVNIHFDYKLPASVVPDDDMFVMNREFSKGLNIYTNQSATAEERVQKPLRNVYVLFRPYFDYAEYNSYGVADTFEIENKSNRDFNLYLVKMIPEGETDLENRDKKYKVAVNVRENTMGENYTDADYRGHTKLFTNLGYNMALEDDKDTSDDERKAAMSGQVEYNYFYSDTSLSLSDKIETDYFVPDYTGERMFNMKVEVFKEGSKASGFKSEDKLSELSN